MTAELYQLAADQGHSAAQYNFDAMKLIEINGIL